MSGNPPPTPDDPFTPPSYGTPMPPPAPFNLPPGFALPPQYYASPDDPLVSNDIGGWWNRSLMLLQKTWLPLLLIHLISVPAVAILTTWVQSEAWKLGKDLNHLTVRDLTGMLVPLAVTIPVGGVLSLLVALASLRVLVQVATGRPVSIGAALLDGLRRTPVLVGWSIPIGLLILLGVVCCIVPGLYFGAAFTVLPAVVLLERGNALARSFRLLHGDFGAALGRIGIYYAVSGIFVIVQRIFTNATAGLAAVSTLVGINFTLASSVVLAPMILTAYADMRARREPFSTAYLSSAPASPE